MLGNVYFCNGKNIGRKKGLNLSFGGSLGADRGSDDIIVLDEGTSWTLSFQLKDFQRTVAVGSSRYLMGIKMLIRKNYSKLLLTF